MSKLMLDFSRSGVPEHTQRSIEYYLLHGLEPGSFLTSVICNDLFAAMGRADPINRKNIEYITYWFTSDAPYGSYGSKEKMQDWMKDTHGHRAAFAKQTEEKFFWKTVTE